MRGASPNRPPDAARRARERMDDATIPPSRASFPNLRAIVLAGGLSSLAAGVALGLNGTGNLGWHAATRVTAVLAFPLWWAAFVAGRFPECRHLDKIEVIEEADPGDAGEHVQPDRD